MRLHRYLKEANIELAFDPFAPSEEEARRRHFRDEDDDEEEHDDEGSEEEDEDDGLTRGQRFRQKVQVIEALVRLLEPSGKITNPRKCAIDLRNREAKATTGLGHGIAMPHVRTQQAKGFAMGVAIAPAPGLWFDAIDDEPVRLLFPMVAPPYDDRYYLKVERALAEAFANPEDLGARDALLAAETPGEVILLLRDLID